jgi:hypothetical protein
MVCLWVWRLLGRDVLARKHCGKLVMGIFDDWNIEKLQKYQQAQANRNPSAARAKFFERLHEFFLGKMKGCDFLSRGRYACVLVQRELDKSTLRLRDFFCLRQILNPPLAGLFYQVFSGITKR